MLTEPSTRAGLAFVVVTYNHREEVGDCLDAILCQTRLPSAVVVVDNGSWDGTPEYLESRYPQVTLVRTGRNLGYGAANNLGVGRVEGQLIAIINPDVRLNPDWSEEMLRAMEDHPECAATEGKLLLSHQAGILNSRGSRLNLIGFGCASGFGSRDRPETKVSKVSYPSGAAFVVRRDAFEGIGGFDPSYFLYHEDVDLGLRLQAQGWSILYVPGAYAYHDFRSGLNRDKVRHLEHNRWKTLVKNMPTSYFVSSGPLLLVVEAGLLVYLALTGLLRSKVLGVLDFVRELRRLLSIRRASHRRQDPWANPARVMTDDFPALVPMGGRWTSVARRVISGYYRAFVHPPQGNLGPDETNLSSPRGDRPERQEGLAGRNWKVALVSSHGGHLTELELLRASLAGIQTFTITYESVRTSERRDIYQIANIGTNPLRMITAFFRIALALAQERPRAVISTGAEIAIPAFILGRLLGLRLIFVESLTRVSHPSGTGLVLYPFSDLFLVQWPGLRERYGPRARYVGSIL